MASPFTPSLFSEAVLTENQPLLKRAAKSEIALWHARSDVYDQRSRIIEFIAVQVDGCRHFSNTSAVTLAPSLLVLQYRSGAFCCQTFQGHVDRIGLYLCLINQIILQRLLTDDFLVDGSFLS